MTTFKGLSKTWTMVPALVVAIILALSTGSASLSSVSNSSSKASVNNCPSGYPCGPHNPNVLVDESQTVNYTSLDPAVGDTNQDAQIFANVFQGLVTYNPHNTTDVVPALSSKWTVGAGPLYKNTPNYYTQWNFTMRDNTWFSNKDPINAYVAWFSFVRAVYMGAYVGYYGSVSLTLNTTNPLDASPNNNLFPDGLQNALASAGLCIVNPKNDSGCVRALNYMLSNFNWHNQTQQKVMTYPDQAYVAKSSSLFQINTIQPYSQTVLGLPGSWNAIVDPQFIDSSIACGGNPCVGVKNNSASHLSYFSRNGMPGSGPYEVGNHTAEKYGKGTAELFLNNNTNYWGDRVTGLEPNVQPAKIGTIDLRFGYFPSRIDDFSTNKAQISSTAIPGLFSPGNFSKLWSSFHSEFPSVPFNNVFKTFGTNCEANLPFNMQYNNYSSFGYSPVNYTNVRQALVHAVNYSEILNKMYTVTNTQDNSTVTVGELFLPPAPPGYGRLDNPQGIPLYSYNIKLSQQLIASAGSKDGFYVILPNGTSLGDKNGRLFSSIVFGWWSGWWWPQNLLQTLLQILNQGFNQIGITVTSKIISGWWNLSPSTTPPLNDSGGWCMSWPDPVFQDFYDFGTPFMMGASSGWVDNATLAHLLSLIPFEPYVGLQLQQTEEAYRIYTQMAAVIQLPVAVNHYFFQPYLQNATYNLFQCGFYYDMMSYGYPSSTIVISTTSIGASNGAFSFTNPNTIVMSAVVLAAAGLLGYAALSRRRASAQVTRRLAAIMFTDLVGFTALGQRNESLSLEVVEEQRRLIRPILEKYKGREVKTMGDAFLVEFASALEAVKCAFDIQGSIWDFNAAVSPEKNIHLRIGIHLGDVVGSGGDISGDAVNVASRIEPFAEDGGVCLTRQVYDQVANKFEHPLQSLGMKELKNVVAPQEIFKIVMPWEGANAPEPSSQRRPLFNK